MSAPELLVTAACVTLWLRLTIWLTAHWQAWKIQRTATRERG